jgi:hypothetical protein
MEKRPMNRSINALFAAALLFPLPAIAQTGPTFMSPTAISAAGSYPTNGISVGPPNNTAVLELQATGSGTGLSFKMQGIPIGSTTPVDLKMYTAPACAATVASGTANGDWFIPVAGFSKVFFVLTSGTAETYGITNSTQPNCATAASSGSLGTVTIAATSATPTAGTSSTLTTGGTAVTIVTGPVSGCYVTNPLTLTDQNIAAAEVAYVNFITTATAAGNGTNTALSPGQTARCVPGQTTNVSAIAATSGHRLTVVKW